MFQEKNRETVQQFFVWLRARGRSAATIESYDYGLRHFLRWLDDRRMRVEDMTMSGVVEFSAMLENRGLRSGARASYITAMKSLFTWLRREGRLSFDPSEIETPIVIDGKRHESAEPEEIEAMVKALTATYPKDVRDRAIIGMLSESGARLCELLSMTFSCLDIQRHSAWIKTYKRRNHFREVYWKPADHLIQPWLAVRQDYLERRGITSAALWIGMDTNNQGEPLKKGAVERMFRVVRTRAGIKRKITPHSCRHGYGSEWARRKGNPYGLRDTLGHASLNTTDIYTQLKNEDLRRMYLDVKDRDAMPA